MGALIKNEFIKLLKKPKTIILLILFLLGAIGITFILYKGGEEAKLWKNPDYRIKSIKEEIGFKKEWLKKEEERFKIETDSEELEKIKHCIASIKSEIEELENGITFWEREKINPTPWQERVKINLENDKKQLIYFKSELAMLQGKREFEGLKKDEEIEALKKSIEQLEEIIVLNENSIEKNIKPLDLEAFEPASLMINCAMILSLGIPLFIALFGSDIVSDEASSETFKFLLIQPVSRMKILMSKFILLVTLLLILIIGTQLVIYIVSGIMNGFDSLELLVKVGREFEYNQSGIYNYGVKIAVEILDSGYYITMKELLIHSMLMQGLFIIASTALVFFITTICKSSAISMAISIGVLVGGSVLPMFFGQMNRVVHMSFLGYSNPLAVIKGELIRHYNNILIKPEYGIILMVVSTIVLLTLANIKFKRKDILV